MTEGLNPFEPPKSDEAPARLKPRRGRETEESDYLVDAHPRTRLANCAVDSALQFMLFGTFGLDALSAILVQSAYWIGFETLFGKTPAKWLTGTRVVTNAGNRPTFAHILHRTIVRFVPFEALSFFGRGRGWHDRWSKTRVVSDREGARQRRP
ncbi:MAG TPA: RDD family protein, partial [Polyangiaceae bacterium]|nr:RDD family protein [Polyangiaceae bacterium]